MTNYLDAIKQKMMDTRYKLNKAYRYQTADEEEDTQLSLQGQPWGSRKPFQRMKPVQTNTLTGQRMNKIRTTLKRSFKKSSLTGQTTVPQPVYKVFQKVYAVRSTIRGHLDVTPPKQWVHVTPISTTGTTDEGAIAPSDSEAYRTRQHSLPLDH